MQTPKYNGVVTALSAAGVLFIVLGLLALALPTPQEGMYVGQLDSDHSFYLMDVAGMFTLGLGVILSWLSGKFWAWQLRF